MASIYRKQKSPFWYLRSIGPDGKARDRSLKLRAGIGAETRRARLLCAEATAREMAVSQRGPGSAFAQWAPAFLSNYTNAFTRARMRACWFWLASYFRERDITHPAQLTRDLVFGYVPWRTKGERARPGKPGRKPGHHNTAMLELKCLSRVMREAVLRGFIASNPCERLGLGRLPAREKEALADAQVARVLEALESEPEWMGVSYRIALHQGVRLRETQVPMSDVHFDVPAGGEARDLIVFNNTKGGKPFGAVLHPALRPLLEKRKRAGEKFTCEVPPNAGQVWHRFFRKKLKMDTTFHATRVTVATRMALAGIEKRLAMLYLNHSSELVHDIYTKLRPEHAAKVTSALDYGLIPKA